MNVGVWVGNIEGLADGDDEGSGVGLRNKYVGSNVGAIDGSADGDDEGAGVGLPAA